MFSRSHSPVLLRLSIFGMLALSLLFPVFAQVAAEPTAEPAAEPGHAARLLPRPADELGPEPPPGVEIRTAIVGGTPLDYQVRGDYAVVDGDVILARLEEVEAAAAAEANGNRTAAIGVNPFTGRSSLWPDATLYYQFDPSLSNQSRVMQAIAQWHERTHMQILPRTAEADYVLFTAEDSGCYSYLGRVGGEQVVNLASGCNVAAAVHEIGHAFGLKHEHQRNDRNQWVTIRYDNVDALLRRQFHQGPDNEDAGYYDYDSVMHYSEHGFSNNREMTIATVPLGIEVGGLQLSAGDVDAVERLYGFVPTATTITTIPAGETIFVDGQEFTAPHSFDWAPGSEHQISAEGHNSSSFRDHFVRWTDGNLQRQRQLVADPGRTVIAAVFRSEERVLTDVALGQGTVEVYPPSPDGFYPVGTRLRLKAVPAEGYQFLGWNPLFAELNGFASGEAEPEFELFLFPLFLAEFTQAPVTVITSDPPGLTLTVDSEDYLTPARFAWAPGSSHRVEFFATQLNFGGNERYQFDGWSDGAEEASLLLISRAITAGSEDAVYGALFATEFALTRDSFGPGTMSVLPGSADGFYSAGTEVEVRGRPLGSGSVQYWLGDTVGGGTLQRIVMDQPRLARAVFGTPLEFRPLNAASFLGSPQFDIPDTAVAPLEMVTLFGDNLGPEDGVEGQIVDGRYATEVAGTKVMFGNFLAPIVYASKHQTTVIVPTEVGGDPVPRYSTVLINVVRNQVITAVGGARIIAQHPAIFTSNASGQGQVAAFNENGTLNSPLRPARPGSVVVIYITGAGRMQDWHGTVIPDGQQMDGTLVRPRAPVFVRVAGVPVRVDYAGSAPRLVNGFLQVNLRLPEGLVGGQLPIELVVGDYASPPGTTISVE